MTGASCMYLTPRIWSIVCTLNNPTNHNMCRNSYTVVCPLFRIFTLAIHSTINKSRHDKFVYGTTKEQFTWSYRHLYNLLTSILFDCIVHICEAMRLKNSTQYYNHRKTITIVISLLSLNSKEIYSGDIIILIVIIISCTTDSRPFVY